MIKSFTIAFLIFISCLILKGEPQQEKDTIIVRLEKRLAIYYDEIIEQMPIEVKLELKKCKSEDEINLTSLTTQDWLDNNAPIYDDRATKLLEALVNLIEKENKNRIVIHGDDVFGLLKETLWCRLNNKPFNIKKKLEIIKLYWLENEKPNIVVAPNSKSKIDWIMVLEVDTRPQGAMHVGIIVDKKKFICFERTIGIYYPEGKILDRIKKQTDWDEYIRDRYSP